MLFARDYDGVSEVVNDVDAELTNFWRVLQKPETFEQFHRLCEATPFSEAEWEAAHDVEYRLVPGFPGYRVGDDGSVWTRWKRKSHGWRYGTKTVVGEDWTRLTPYVTERGYLRYTLVRTGEKRLIGGHVLVLESFVGPRPDRFDACHNDGNPGNNRLVNLRWDTHSNNELDKAVHKSAAWQAWRFFVCCRQSLAGRGRNFTPITTSRVRKGKNEQVSGWLSAVEGLPAVHERLKRVLILNRDGCEVIRQFDVDGAVIYCDPPYPTQTRAAKAVYKYEMATDDHGRFLATVKAVTKAKVAVSSYRNDDYDRELSGWRVAEFEVANHAAGGSSKRRMTEVVYLNF